jgi:hypothetical protein
MEPGMNAAIRPKFEQQAATARGSAARGSAARRAVFAGSDRGLVLKLPETPMRPDFGNASDKLAIRRFASDYSAQVIAAKSVTTIQGGSLRASFLVAASLLSCHEAWNRGNFSKSLSQKHLRAKEGKSDRLSLAT